MSVPSLLLVKGHVHWRFGRTPAVEAVRTDHQVRAIFVFERGGIIVIVTNLCISLAEVRMPRHSNKMIPTTAMDNKTRVRVKNTHIALVGGSWAFADFQVMPPLGRSILRGLGVALDTTLTLRNSKQIKGNI